MSSGLRSGTALSRQLLWIRQTPDRSGLPSADRGAGAERLGLPSGVLGTPAVGRLGHCAVSGDNDAERTIRLASVFICHLPSDIIHTFWWARLDWVLVLAVVLSDPHGRTGWSLRRSQC